MGGGLTFALGYAFVLTWSLFWGAVPGWSSSEALPRQEPPREAPDSADLPSVLEDDEKEVDAQVDAPPWDDDEVLAQQRFQEHLQAAQAAMRVGNYDLAIREYTEANKLQPGDPDVLIRRAEARFARRGSERCPRSGISDLLAVATYDPRGRWPEQRARVLDWMQSCGNDYYSERLQIARELASERVGAPGRPAEILVVLAGLEYAGVQKSKSKAERDERRAAALDVLERYRAECKAQGRTPAFEALRLQGAINRELDRLDEAIAAYSELREHYPGEEAAKEAGEWLQELRDEKTLREWERSQGGKPTPQAERDYQRGAKALQRGDLATAEMFLTAAVEQSPWYARANYALGVVQARNGRLEEAVESLEKAVLADRSNYQARVKLGLIYKQEFGGTRDEDARTHLETAVRLRPDLDVLHLHLGELYARTDRELARMHYRRFIDRAESSDPYARRARQALDELDRNLREDEPLTVPPPPRESLRYLEPELQRMINEAYLKGTEQNNWERAEQILREARARYPDEPVVVNELAKVMYAQSRFGDARTYWEQSLQMRSDQVYVHEQLGLLLESDLPDEALPHLRRAAEASPVARFHVAQLLWRQRDFFDASTQLDRYLLEADRHDLYWARAGELRKEMDRAFLYGGLAFGFVLLLLIGVPAWRWYRRWRGASLSQLLDRHPKSFPEVARVLSLIRHEILKHNTAFLADVGQALEYETSDANYRSSILGRRLFGDLPAKGRLRRRGTWENGGIYGRFLGYVQELERVARNHGVRLNLHRKDPIFRPMIKAFETLRRRAYDIKDPGKLRHTRRAELARMLSWAGHVLGRQAFARLSGLIQALCIVEVDPAFVRHVYEQVSGEEQFSGIALAPVQIEGLAARVRVFRTDLEDILANIVRNSLLSSLKYAQPPIGLGIGLTTEVDDITGLASLAIRIKDRSPEQLSNEMLRGRYVERGMGITVDLLSRYDGSIGVEPEAGWEKAVVLRFFTLEEHVAAPSGSSVSMRVAS